MGRSLWIDLKILFLTLRTLVFGRGYRVLSRQ